MCPLRSVLFQGLHHYYGTLRPCAPPRYFHPRRGCLLGLFPSHRDDRFPRSAQEPGPGSRHLHAGHRSANRQASAELIAGQPQEPGFDVGEMLFDTSSVVHLRSSSSSIPDVFMTPFPSTLTTPALYRSSLRWFETRSCNPIPRGLPSSLMQHCHSFRLAAFGGAFVAHNGRGTLFGGCRKTVLRSGSCSGADCG